MDFNQNIIVRTMQKSDINIISRNYIEQDWYKSKETLEAYFNGQEDGSLYMFIAELNDDIAGYVILYPDTTTGPFAFKKIPCIKDFVVFKKYQRKGIGNKILDELEKKASELSDKVQLCVGLHSGYGAAQRIYIKRGYMPDGTGVWYNNSQLEQYADCQNNDDLVLFLVKDLVVG